MASIAIIDYGMGNLHSVASALEHVGAERVLVTHDAEVIREADRVVFPGVGAMRDCMAEIRRLKCDELLADALLEQHKPVLAICVGMQALMTNSEENNGVDCLNLIPGQVRYFGNPLTDAGGSRLKVPHMGWNAIRTRAADPLTTGLDEKWFYFVHSYAAPIGDWTLATSHHGSTFSAVVRRNNFSGAQFHPERSAAAGARLLRNFLEMPA